MNQQLKFINGDQSSFYTVLRARVDDYFLDKQSSKYANSSMVFKTVLYITATVLLYGLILADLFPLYVQLLLAITLGVTMAFVGFNICHDALHGAYSSNKQVNNGLGLLFDILGANGYLWRISHNVVHHTYTNIPGHDEDIEIAPGLIRVAPEDKANKIQRYQHIYAFALYGFTSLSWFFWKDYVKFFKKCIGNKKCKHPKIEYFNLFFYKIIYYSLFILTPLLVLDITWWQFLIGYIAMNMATGYVMGLVFQLAHVVEDTNFPHPDVRGNIQESWAVHQMMTTANFASQSNLAHFLCGGLNLQIEHHLFPRICHIHYKGLSGIVKETAQEFGLPYHENRDFFSALRSHYFLLKRMGRAALVPAPVRHQ